MTLPKWHFMLIALLLVHRVNLGGGVEMEGRRRVRESVGLEQWAWYSSWTLGPGSKMAACQNLATDCVGKEKFSVKKIELHIE